MLLRAAEQRLAVGAVGVRPAERAQVGVELQQPPLAVASTGAASRPSSDAAAPRGRHVVAEHEPGAAAASALGRAGVGRAGDRARPARPRRRPARPRAARSAASGRPAGTCALGETSTSRTRPCDRRGERGLHLHALGDRHDVAGAAPRRRRTTGIATTTPGAWLRTRPPSSREMRCGTPSTSTSRSASCSAVSVRYERAAVARSALVLGDRSTLRLDPAAVDLDAGSARADLRDAKR